VTKQEASEKLHIRTVDLEYYKTMGFLAEKSWKSRFRILDQVMPEENADIWPGKSGLEKM